MMVWYIMSTIAIVIALVLAILRRPQAKGRSPLWLASALATLAIVFAISVMQMMQQALGARDFDFASTLAAPPERIGVFGAWTVTRTARVEGQRYNCQADSGPLDPPAPDDSPWARARLAVYVGGNGAGSLAFWVRRTLPAGPSQAMLVVGQERISMETRWGTSPVRTPARSHEILNLIWQAAATQPGAIVSVYAPPAPYRDPVEERFSLAGFREAVHAAMQACRDRKEGSDSLVMDAGLVRFGDGWNIHALPTETPGTRLCFAAARRFVTGRWPLPAGPEPAGPRLFLSRDAGPGGGPLLGFDAGRTFAADARVEIVLGSERFVLDVRNGLAEAPDPARLLHAMLSAPAAQMLEVRHPGADRTEVTDRFSLNGFRYAHDALSSYCG